MLHNETRSGLREKFGLYKGRVLLASFFLISPFLLGHNGDVLAAQTRDQCEKCCKGRGLDEYYAEQCRLKCFRNPDSCVGKESEPRSAPESAASPPPQQQPAEPPPQQQRVQPPPPQQPPQQMRTAPAQRQPPPPRAAQGPPREFQWPNPLNLAPGKEWEAAGLIVSINGIPPQHPNHQRALKAVEGVLVEFLRANPRGGDLPTGVLENIVRQLR